MQIADRRDGCFIEVWASELISMEPTQESADPPPSTLNARARGAVGRPPA